MVSAGSSTWLTEIKPKATSRVLLVTTAGRGITAIAAAGCGDLRAHALAMVCAADPVVLRRDVTPFTDDTARVQRADDHALRRLKLPQPLPSNWG